MKKILGILLIALSASSVQAQEQKSLSRQADIYYSKYDYARAASMYERVVARRKEKTPTIVIARLANSYREINDYGRAADWYSKLLARPDAPPDARLYYADMLKSLGRYAEAKAAYSQYAQSGATSPVLQNKIEGCNAAEDWMQHPTNVNIINVERLNTAKSDWGAVYYPGTGSIVFMSDTLYRNQLDPGSKHNRNRYERTGRNYYRLYAADTGKYGYVFVRDFSPAFNKYKYHSGPVVFTNDYRRAYYTLTYPERKLLGKVKKGKPAVTYGYRRLELYEAEMENNGQWKNVGAFPYNNPDQYSLGHAAISGDGSIIYFASDMPGGQGGTDIWYCERQADGKWSAPVNCGPTINTADDEEFPTIALDGGLFFASKGWVGMGGFDIFHATGSRAQWSAPENLRYPTNSPGDDFYFMPVPNGSTYFASNRMNGKGSDDIYMINTPQIYTVNKIPTMLVIPFTGTVCPQLAGTCIYIYNKQRDMGWCFLGESGREINLMLERDTDYEIRITYPNMRREIKEFNTRGMKAGEPLNMSICK
ncbi:tetratricopeptide repeat protein [Chitinophaga silvatica]|uniref:Tetratricopeptide repeat protein n=1 Tax=Chitinophaga silvatica TaxID=2282649 RepID=A0A3E1Y713_9BACT|nr:tetratricopeptide repeat protein [Chitinophaga silvatica]RFS20709.1 tetratricopeptide repeat protein [Chitinophaga silvatica]